MKTTVKKIGTWALVVALIVLIVYLLKWCNGQDAPGTGQPVDSLYYKHITDSTRAAVLFGAKEDFGNIEKSYKDSIAKLLAIKPKTIKEFVTIIQETESTLTPTGPTENIYAPVTPGWLVIESMTGEFKNNYFQAQVGLGKDMFMNLKGNDTITGVWAERTIKRKKYFEFTAMNSNPDVTISGIKAFRSPEIYSRKDWSIGIQGGYGITLQRNQVLLAPYIGFGLQRNIFSFNLKKKK